MNDTIAAISTALGVGAISIIRVSGKDSINIVNKIFKGKDLTKVDSHTIHYGHIIENDNIIDEVLVTVMKAPKTFTTEDIVEINSHGGIATTNKVLELVLTNGSRLAEPGEFTKRAFLNGRIDLIEADGIMNLINAKNEKTRTLSINQLSGKVSNMIKNLRDNLIQIISNIEVNIDYPEYEDIEVLTNDKILPDILEFKNQLLKIIKESEDGKLLNEGINVGIIGKPNVGKSSLLNALLEEEKAIVTDIEGTTRDIVEGKINLGGLTLNIIDTAGIRQTTNIVEKIGVDKSIEIIDSSDLIIFMLNNNEEISKEEIQLLNKIKDKPNIIVINKIDLENKLTLPNINTNIIKISIKDNIGIDSLKDEIKKIYNLEEIETTDMTYLSNARSISLLKQSLSKIEESITNINNNSPIDIVELDLKNAWELLGEIIGETYTEELIDELFSRFCLGK
jgi:tRNA modification GTPase